MSSIASKASAPNVNTEEELNNNAMNYANTSNNTADQSNTCLKTEIDNNFTTSNSLINTTVNLSSVDLEGVFRLVKSVDNTTFSIERLSLNSASNSMVWSSLLSIEYNVDTMHCRFYVYKTDICAKLNVK